MGRHTRDFVLESLSSEEKMIEHNADIFSANDDNVQEVDTETIETFITILKKNDIRNNYLKDIGRIKLLKTSEDL